MYFGLTWANVVRALNVPDKLEVATMPPEDSCVGLKSLVVVETMWPSNNFQSTSNSKQANG